MSFYQTCLAHIRRSVEALQPPPLSLTRTMLQERVKAQNAKEHALAREQDEQVHIAQNAVARAFVRHQSVHSTRYTDVREALQHMGAKS